MPENPPSLDCFVFSTGYCLASESHLIRGGDHRQVRCHALVALLHHPEHGYLLWDSGYAPRMLTAVQRWPFQLYARLTPLRITPEQAAIRQVERHGLSAADIQRVIISHFHADHIAGLGDFPAAAFLATPEAYQHVAGQTGFGALRRGLIPELLPADFAARFQPIGPFDGPPLPGLGGTFDLFQDGSLLFCQLPGHARGQVGLLAHTNLGELLFAADAAWTSAAIRLQRPPSRLAGLIWDDPRQAERTLAGLAQLSMSRPAVRIIPTHCPEVAERYLSQ